MLAKRNSIHTGKPESISLIKSIAQDKKNIVSCIIVILILIAGVIFVYHDYEWYDTSIVKLEKVENSLSKESSGNNIGERHYEQTVTGRIMNGEQKGRQVQMQNKYSSSDVYDDEYKAGDEVFVQSITDHNGTLTGTI
jgi:uncharacterized membrane protein